MFALKKQRRAVMRPGKATYVCCSNVQRVTMPRYNKDNVKGLKELLYNSYVHDAELENAEFDFKEDSIKITLFNPIFGAKINFTFLNIETALTIKGDWQGERTTVVSLTVEEDFSYLQKYLPNHGEYMDSLYLLFQTFSGNELHIVSKEVIVEVV